MPAPTFELFEAELNKAIAMMAKIISYDRSQVGNGEAPLENSAKAAQYLKNPTVDVSVSDRLIAEAALSEVARRILELGPKLGIAPHENSQIIHNLRAQLSQDNLLDGIQYQQKVESGHFSHPVLDNDGLPSQITPSTPAAGADAENKDELKNKNRAALTPMQKMKMQNQPALRKELDMRYAPKPSPSPMKP